MGTNEYAYWILILECLIGTNIKWRRWQNQIKSCWVLHYLVPRLRPWGAGGGMSTKSWYGEQIFVMLVLQTNLRDMEENIESILGQGSVLACTQY
ncbi:uncharacterized protein Bfra_001170 [Botrytis fragariae]|uniref:Uncharacterized protein n=1 Tax=Botrytis fragariae TaxID=1964551 RepID=A0A8H6B4S5_9HELO|nr:uncharacterized protein Bfra_001170 [Botrytis fragariae]KAF5878997.1 hypothetical protein Bfra_001170 [Botrytis fragariae]